MFGGAAGSDGLEPVGAFPVVGVEEGKLGVPVRTVERALQISSVAGVRARACSVRNGWKTLAKAADAPSPVIS